MSDYRIQIIDTKTRQVAKGWQPGDRVEADLVADVLKRLESRPIGLFKGKASVLTEVERAMLATIYALKERI